jgi:sterol desaturase/sphingolipid hydroxylase (fatty acid hydroxylase superfamily)
LLHVPYFYAWIHKRHHEFITPYALSNEIAHPLEFLFNWLLPIVAGPFIIGWFQPIHILTFWAWIIFRELRGADAHSGYDLPFHPLRILSPIYGGPRAHDMHHSVHGRGTNFGGYLFWDKVCGTEHNPTNDTHRKST